MNETYESILTRMTDTFTEQAGFGPDSASDIGIRMKLLAGEIYSLSTEINWLKTQMFPHTATGAQLDLHAQQRGLTRRKGRKASGIVLFMLEMPLEYSFVIPAGTVCTVDDGSLNFVTKQEGRIAQGSTLAWLECEAEDSGERYNVANGSVKTIVTYLSVGIRINNSSGFSGGTDDEDDESLRQRILESCRNIPNGADAAFYQTLAESVDGIHSASVYGNPNAAGQVIVILGGRGAAPTADAAAEAFALLSRHAPLGVRLVIQNTALTNIDVSVSVSVKSGYTFNEVQTRVQQNIQNFFLQMKVGESFFVSALGKAILETDGVENYVFGQDMQDTAVNQSSMAVLDTLTVTQISE